MKNLVTKQLSILVEDILLENKIWESEFFQKLNDEHDYQDCWKMLVTWTENMIRASYGFQTYVLYLAAQAKDERVRRLLVENEWEELGDYEYPKRSHFQMVRKLAKLCGIENKYIENPRLLPSSAKHIETHIERCKTASFYHGLGMIYLIENLTRLEFERVLRGFIRFWELGTGKNLEEFALNGGIEYFTANIEADDGHAEDVEKMILVALECEGINLKDEKQIAPYIQQIAEGMKESISLRNAFLEGVYNAVFANREVVRVA